MIVDCVTQVLKDHGPLQSVFHFLVTTQKLILEESVTLEAKISFMP